MRALFVRQFGKPDSLNIEDRPAPQPQIGEAIVQVKAAAINPSDVKNIEGKMHGTTLPRIPGRDFAGIVSGGPANLIGREVWGTGGDIGFTRDGSHAEFISLPLAALAEKPVNLSMEAAGSAGVTFVTAWSALVTAVELSESDRVLILGANGGVGSAALQIARSRGAKVIAAVRSEEDVEKVRAAGAAEVVIITTQNLSDAVRALTGGRGADVVFDTSGAMFAESVDAAAHGGRLAVISSPADGKATFNLRDLYRKEIIIHGVDSRALDAVACATLLNQMKAGFESGAFTAGPGEPFPLGQAARAYGKVAGGGGRAFFKI